MGKINGITALQLNATIRRMREVWRLGENRILATGVASSISFAGGSDCEEAASNDESGILRIGR